MEARIKHEHKAHPILHPKHHKKMRLLFNIVLVIFVGTASIAFFGSISLKQNERFDHLAQITIPPLTPTVKPWHAIQAEDWKSLLESKLFFDGYQKQNTSERVIFDSGHYYSLILGLNIHLSEGYHGKEERGVLAIRKEGGNMPIIIVRSHKKYSSFDQAVSEFEQNNQILAYAKRKSVFNKNYYEGKSYIINIPENYYKGYIFYDDRYMYHFFITDQSLVQELDHLAPTSFFATVPINPVERQVFDMNKLLNGKYETYHNKEIGFTIEYPPEIKPQIHKEEAKHAFVHLENNIPIGAVTFGFVPQPPGTYEVYDGFVLQIIYFEKTEDINLEQLVYKVGNGYNEYGFGTKVQGIVQIGSVSGWKLASCCYGEESIFYIFPMKNDDFFIKISISSSGQDRKDFDKVTERMVQSLQFIE